MKNIIVVCPFGIGDVLFTTPFIAALKEEAPDIRISYIGNARTFPVLKNDPRLHKVFSYERDEFFAVYKKSPWAFLRKWQGFITDIRREKFDAAFDFSLGSPLGLALMLAGVPLRIGYDYKGRGRWLTQKIPLKGFEGRPVAGYYLELLKYWKADHHKSGRAGAPPGMALFPSESDRNWARDFLAQNSLSDKKFLCLYPGGGASWGKGAHQKRWPAGQYAKLADKIIEKTSLALILMGDKSEIELCETVKNAMRGPKAINAAGKTSVLQAAALVCHARCVVANDGGPLHVAVASGVPTASIFGPVDSVVYGPFPAKGHKVIIKGLSCQPCYRRFRMTDCQHLSCLKELSVEEVFNQVEVLL
ncbi:MAG: glycosyltransferase family 9 protein [Candidatus Omnitrophica bacterium]|nr:glycosyltransferase family 9 protein [Candidatus Omnitrophota bacterium]